MEKQVSINTKNLLDLQFGADKAFRKTNLPAGYDPADFERQIRQAGIDPAGRFIASVCIGIRPDFDKKCDKKDFREFTRKILSIYNDIRNYFFEQKCGFETFCNEEVICMACFFEKMDSEAFAETIIQPLLQELEKRYELLFFAGIGTAVDEPERFEETIDSAYRAYQSYFFNPTQMIVLNKEARERRYAAIDEYFQALESAFRSVLIHDPEAAEKLTSVLDVLYDFHYGNRQAMIMHTMEYTGCIAMRLKQYRLLELDFFEMQNKLQARVCHTATYQELREIIYKHFERLLPLVYMSDRPKAKLVIEQVKEYTREHYMDNITVEYMAEFAHFSTDYFSHLFKNETGTTYKVFLTQIRMKHAVELLRNTEYRVAEISDKVGYNNPRAFCDAFKQVYSISPMEYRRIHRKK